jgi:hypothetical protein
MKAAAAHSKQAFTWLSQGQMLNAKETFNRVDDKKPNHIKSTIASTELDYLWRYKHDEINIFVYIV